MLPAGEQVRDVWLHQGGLIEAAVAEGKPLLIDCSTIDVATARTVAEAAEAAGLDMLDAPVSGGTVGAAAGTLTFMVGGSDAAFRARASRCCEAWARRSFHAGGPGAGQAAKICNNMMLAITMSACREGFLLAREARSGLRQAMGHHLHGHGTVLGADELLPGAGAGAERTVQPRLRARVHGAR